MDNWLEQHIKISSLEYDLRENENRGNIEECKKIRENLKKLENKLYI